MRSGPCFSEETLTQRLAIFAPLVGRGAEARVDIVTDHLVDPPLACRDEGGGVALPACDARVSRPAGSGAVDQIVEGGAPGEESGLVHRLAMAGDERDELRGRDRVERL